MDCGCRCFNRLLFNNDERVPERDAYAVIIKEESVLLVVEYDTGDCLEVMFADVIFVVRCSLYGEVMHSVIVLDGQRVVTGLNNNNNNNNNKYS